jgi:nitroimidazol reductase NimA-like FMN-containing flavoprotein (pyridoxamine 5'-phosphate oxidase superfamily)
LRELIEKKSPVCISATLIDGLVLARSAFHHSVNYRSAVLFAIPEKVSDEKDLYRVLEAFTNKMQPGRWNDVRKPSPGEWKATQVIAFNIDEASAKIRTGPPKDDDEDYTANIWAGVVPLALQRCPAIPDPALAANIDLPPYLH